MPKEIHITAFPFQYLIFFIIGLSVVVFVYAITLSQPSCPEGEFSSEGGCCTDTDGNGECDEGQETSAKSCGEGESLIDSDCCIDQNTDGFCDEATCPAGHIETNSGCCEDSNADQTCDN